MTINTDDCWLYAGSKNASGYSRLWAGNRYNLVHRIMWEYTHNREIPKEYMIDHLCRVRCCINPDHLEAVTSRENTLRGETLAAMFAKRKSCKHGHPFDETNTRMHGNTRRCRKCVLLSVERWKSKKQTL